MNPMSLYLNLALSQTVVNGAPHLGPSTHSTEEVNRYSTF